MNTQLQIPFQFPADMFTKLKEQYRIADMLKMEAEIQSLKNSIRTHKGNYTKIKTKQSKA